MTQNNPTSITPTGARKRIEKIVFCTVLLTSMSGNEKGKFLPLNHLSANEFLEADLNPIIPWKCHICGKGFDMMGGGLCPKCRKPTCRLHLSYFGLHPTGKSQCKICKNEKGES
jgi:hypothetical protein